MIRWQDLPLEPREAIVELLDEHGDISSGIDASSENYRALRALTLVDRDFLHLVLPILWSVSQFRRQVARRVLDSYSTLAQ